MINYCTLFNSTYLSRGVAMYYSLERVSSNFHLYIFAFDDKCYTFLKRLNLTHATIIALTEFEDERLLEVKPTRTAGEYCWTCTSSTILYCIETFSLESCIYIDADLLFFNDPVILFEEMGNSSVLITEHRYTSEYDKTVESGKYCVQFITFKNDINGLRALRWWRDACLEWCFNRHEDGKFGDQKYLDDWQARFDGVHVLQHLGGGVAPWNAQQYSFSNKGGQLTGREKSSGHTFPVIFYHFHDFRYCRENTFRLSTEQYKLDENVAVYLYSAYLKALVEAERQLLSIGAKGVFHEPEVELTWVREIIGRRLTFFLKGHYRNYYRKKVLLKAGQEKS